MVRATRPGALPAEEALYRLWEEAVAFRLFAEGLQPTLTVPEQIAASVGERIISGALPPRARILEQELAAEFAVSRGPVRDAVRILEREGLVTILARPEALRMRRGAGHSRSGRPQSGRTPAQESGCPPSSARRHWRQAPAQRRWP